MVPVFSTVPSWPQFPVYPDSFAYQPVLFTTLPTLQFCPNPWAPMTCASSNATPDVFIDPRSWQQVPDFGRLWAPNPMHNAFYNQPIMPTPFVMTPTPSLAPMQALNTYPTQQIPHPDCEVKTSPPSPILYWTMGEEEAIRLIRRAYSTQMNENPADRFIAEEHCSQKEMRKKLEREIKSELNYGNRYTINEAMEAVDPKGPSPMDIVALWLVSNASEFTVDEEVFDLFKSV